MTIAHLIDDLIQHHDVLRIAYVGAQGRPDAAALEAQFRSRADDAAIRPEAAWVCAGGTTSTHGAEAAQQLVAWANAHTERGPFQAVLVIGEAQAAGVRTVLRAAGGRLANVLVVVFEP